MAGHSHDNIDWDEHLQRLRDGDELNAPEIAGLVAQLLRPTDRTLIEVGAGAGGVRGGAGGLGRRADRRGHGTAAARGGR
ncbi:hypothetical protein [Saccharopolyspora hattusasensis]|uniref:hypothetical protein n=1 Tax=Saccharopolyspora hattusasensis TaxID=1128679 RepID=UPI003D97E194